ncbi:tyrosine-type recombinase/integrase [Stella sp.]|uniref:tyrosine-type recombinase/integrase n=1 Tax=Stella sp. TaxID=2912054 RepID=UPI0035B0D906
MNDSSIDTTIAPMTIATALSSFLESGNHSDASRKNYRSMVKKFCEMANVDDGMILTAAALQTLFAGILPARFNVSRKRWSNIRSAVRAIARHVGVLDDTRAGRVVRSADWEALWTRLPKRPFRPVLTAFVTYCSGAGTAPDAVNDDALEAFADYRATQTTKPLTSQHRSRIVAMWNRAVAEIDGWPQTRLTPRPRRPTIAQQLEAFPASFRAELETYLADHRDGPDDPFASGYRRRLAPKTVKHRRQLVLSCARAMVAAGVEETELKTLADLVRPELVKRALTNIYANNGKNWPPSAPTLCSHLCAIARDCDQPPEVIESLQGLARKVGANRQPGLPPKVRERLHRLNRPEVKAKLFALPALLSKAAAGHLAAGRPRRAVSVHEGALLFALLPLMPMRVRNICSLDLDRHFLRDRQGRAVALHIPADETKNDRPIDWEMPEEFIRLLYTHETTYRPLLDGAAGSRWLFPGPEGRHNVPETLSRLVGRLGEQHLGVRTTAHLFRHLVASMLFEDDPRNVAVAQHVLGHTTDKVTGRMYGELSMKGAVAEHGKMLDREREKLAGVHLRRRVKGKR